MLLRSILLSASLAAWAAEVDVAGNGQWKDSGVAVQAGDLIQFEGSGTLQFPQAPEAGPNGLSRGWKDLLRILPFNDAGRGALIGRIGDSAAARPFLIGERRELRAPINGQVFVAANVSGESPEGALRVKITVVKGTTPASTFSGQLPSVTQEQLDSIPPRVADLAGTPGDRTNFLLIGTEKRVRQALDQAGWVIVDRSIKETVLSGVLATLNRQSYVTIPMSELYLFERPQDFGYAQADPLRVVAARHHFRIWKAPFQAGDQTVWVGAGTEDIGFDKDQRNGNVTHKIDPDVDKERDYIGESLKQTGLVVKTAYMMPAKPVRKAKTAHGEEFFSDGRTLIIWLAPEEAGETAQSGKTDAKG